MENKINSKLLRILLFIFIISFMVLQTRNIYSEKHYEQCNYDYLLDITDFLNSYIKTDKFTRSLMMITSSTLIDLSALALSLSFILYAKNWASLLSIGLFYGLRGLCNVIYMMKAPEGLIWESPGIPSASVSYHDTTDFFFSGHVGINLIAAIELYRFGRKYFSFVSCIGIVVQIITMLIFRGHYAVDIIAGLIAGNYCNLIANKYSKYIDEYWNVDDNVSYLFKIFGKEL
jgi:hypothetical protein